MSGRLDSIAEWLKNNTEHFSEYNYVRVNPTDTDGYFGASSFDILWNLSSVNYGWIILHSDNQKSVIFGRLVSGNAEWDIPAFKSDLDSFAEKRLSLTISNFNSYVKSKTNRISFFAFSNAVDSPFSFQTGFCIAFNHEYLIRTDQFCLIGMSHDGTKIETKRIQIS